MCTLAGVHLREIQIQAEPLERFDPLIGPEAAARLHAGAERAREAFHGRTLFNVNSTAVGGGVAEMLQPLLAYSRGAGIDARWLVLQGEPEFFRITKRLHNRLHGSRGDGGPLGETERAAYERVIAANAAELLALVGPEDVALLHDPQTAGLVPLLARTGATVVWRSHIGTERWNDEVETAWTFLRRYVEEAQAVVFTREAYVPAFLSARAVIIPPSVDPFSVKNAPLQPEVARGILARVGILLPACGVVEPALYRHADGSPGRVDHCADVVRAGPAPAEDAPLVLQVSRWDGLKDMAGVMDGFARVADALDGAHLALVGPNVAGVEDDPEGAEVFEACIRRWRTLPHALRRRIQLVCLPMQDRDENAAIVNALQRHAAVVVQKSLEEGFGLTVAEAMWKSRPVVGSAVGGISEQLVDGESGLLVRDPRDLDAFGAALVRLFEDPDLAGRLGRAAHERTRAHFLGSRHLLQYAELFAGLLGRERVAPAPVAAP
ncbi:MAG: Trehalose synthase [Pseudomonadota bacterium]